LSTLARPFTPFFFFNRGEDPAIDADDLPFTEPIGTRGAIVTFASSFVDPACLDAGLLDDLALLTRLPLGNCAYGATSSPLHPFLCELEPGGPPTAAAVLRALRADQFSSKHIGDLNRAHLSFTGYQPDSGRRVENDEIHDDFGAQYLFVRTDDQENRPGAENEGAHGELRRNVVDGHLWYVLLHAAPRRGAAGAKMRTASSHYVVLLAVGRSLRGPRLVGVVTHQPCHNLCD
jgi:hypothetical protein